LGPQIIHYDEGLALIVMELLEPSHHAARDDRRHDLSNIAEDI
jgi:5-methylthioribose kinase